MDAEAIVGEAALRATMAQIVMNAFPGVHDVDITKIAQGKKSFRWRVLIFVTEKFHDDFSSAKSTKILEALYDKLETLTAPHECSIDFKDAQILPTLAWWKQGIYDKIKLPTKEIIDTTPTYGPVTFKLSELGAEPASFGPMLKGKSDVTGTFEGVWDDSSLIMFEPAGTVSVFQLDLKGSGPSGQRYAIVDSLRDGKIWYMWPVNLIKADVKCRHVVSGADGGFQVTIEPFEIRPVEWRYTNEPFGPYESCEAGSASAIMHGYVPFIEDQTFLPL